MNDKKISFIICCNNEFYMKECRLYLSELIIPEGYEVEILEIMSAKSMAAGCNEGMLQSDAKYKIYLHQDVFITNKEFLLELLRIFRKDAKIGMVGLVGTPYMVRDGTMWRGVRFGGFYKLQERLEKELVYRFFPVTSGYMEVEAVDGLLMATQYDIAWREDLFQKWDFYDVSQSFEFIKAGYKVVVPGQNSLWYIHDCGVINLKFYNDERQKFLKAYDEYMGQRKTESWENYLEQVKSRIIKGYHGDENEKQHLLKLVNDLKEE